MSAHQRPFRLLTLDQGEGHGHFRVGQLGAEIDAKTPKGQVSLSCKWSEDGGLGTEVDFTLFGWKHGRRDVAGSVVLLVLLLDVDVVFKIWIFLDCLIVFLIFWGLRLGAKPLIVRISSGGLEFTFRQVIPCLYRYVVYSTATGRFDFWLW